MGSSLSNDRIERRVAVPASTVSGWVGRYVVAVGILNIVLGFPLTVGGVWLIFLGGSWYYALAGAVFAVAGVLLVRRRMAGVWLYLAAYVATLAWSLWEKGLSGWPLVPRLLAPTVLLVLVLLCVPALRRTAVRPRGDALATAAAALLLVVSAAMGTRLLGMPVQAVANPVAQPSATTAAPPVSPASRPVLEAGADWPTYGGSSHATRYSPLSEINRDNVSRLERAWLFRTRDLPRDGNADYAPETTPLKIGKDLYLCSAMNVLIAVDAVTGLEEWRYDPGVPVDAIPYSATCRGVAFFELPGAEPDAFCGRRIIEGTLDARLIAVDARTGQPCREFGINGHVYLEEGMGRTAPSWVSVTSPPTIVGGIVVVGHQVLDGQAEDAPSGVIRGYDAVTGELAWAWDLGRPERRGKPAPGDAYTRGTPNMWTIASADEELGHVYLPMGNSSVDYYGANRSAAENRYSTALVALDVATGTPVWHFQTVHYDVWDYDLGSQPTLVDFPTASGSVPALVLATKQGDIYILDRRTGASLFPVEERPVPCGGVEPQNLSPTQPFSAYHSLLMPPLREKDMWGFTPIDQLWCRIQYRRSHYQGVYTPPTADRRWIQFPGYNGGNDWGSVAVDVERGILVVNYNNIPNHNRLVPRERVNRLGVTSIDRSIGTREDAPNDLDPQVGAPYGIDVNAGWRVAFTGMPCTEPPYGGIRAIELATGRTLWDRPLGTARRNGPFGIPSHLPFTIGTPNNGGPLVTAGGLIFIAAATDNLIRAIDIATGEVLWQDVLPAGGQATPMTYEEGGSQYLVLMAGGHHFMETSIGDHLIAWALPRRE
jgi:quinoprotein glucose dehydrogenase